MLHACWLVMVCSMIAVAGAAQGVVRERNFAVVS